MLCYNATVRSDALTVEGYLENVPEDRRAKLRLIRGLCLEYLPDHEEAMEWGMPVYRRGAKAEFAWASQARYSSLYIMKENVRAANAERLAGLKMGKGCLRLKPSQEIDAGLLRDLLIATAASPESPC
jgi:uncharacterized protein YdhG (YjbR/CyaY superfamily)